LRGTVVTDRASSTVAAARGGYVLQGLQMPKGAVADCDIGQIAGRRAADDVVRPGHAAYGGEKQNGSQTNTQASSKGFR
jgi:alanine racemase